jgi:ribonuclease HII
VCGVFVFSARYLAMGLHSAEREPRDQELVRRRRGGGGTPTVSTEAELLGSGVGRLACMDEVGRGALAGPVLVGVVVLTKPVTIPPQRLRDSKLLTPRVRGELVPEIRSWVTEWATGAASSSEIDRYGLTVALGLAGKRALKALTTPIDHVLLDGNQDWLSTPIQGTLFAGIPDGGDAPPTAVPVTTRIQADLECAGVAAASVLAKIARDSVMEALAARYPAYGWAENKGYGTESHRAAIKRYGLCEEHRKSWKIAG